MRGLRYLAECFAKNAILLAFYSGYFVFNAMGVVEKLIFTGG